MSQNNKDPARIWVLGGKSLRADKNIPWQENIPNLSNSDRLIIDLNTLLPNISIPVYEIRTYIRYMLMAGKNIYVILRQKSKEDQSLLANMFPVVPVIIEVKPADYKEINWLNGKSSADEVAEYCKYITDCSFFINGIDCKYLAQCLNPHSGWASETYHFSSQIDYISQELQFEILNVACQAIGLSSFFYIRNSKDAILDQTGHITFLPPTTKISTEDAVDVLVNSLVGLEIKEDEPAWSLSIQMPHVKELSTQIDKEKSLITETEKRIVKFNEQQLAIEKHKKLLWTFDKPLEMAVCEAFKLLGFSEIHGGRSKELEDLVINFKTTPEFSLGVMEVKGREKEPQWQI